MAPKKLVLFTDSYPFGSAEPFLKNELELLSQRFDEITIIPLGYGTSRDAREMPKNVKATKPILNNAKDRLELLVAGLLNVAPIGKSITDLAKAKAWQSGKTLWSWGIGLLQARSVLSNKYVKQALSDGANPTLYFYWGIRSSLIIPFVAQRYPEKRIAVRFHGSDIYEETNGGYIHLRKQQLMGIGRAYFCSEYGRSYIVSRYPFMESKAEVARLGVHKRGDGFGSNDGTLRVLTISNLVPLKRVDLLANALAKVKANVEWTHVGDGEARILVEEAASHFPPNVKLQLLGRLPNDEVVNLITNHPFDLFVNVSSSEGVPVSIMEALSFGIPVMATAVGGTPELVDNSVGILLKADIAAEELAQEIEAYAKNEQKSKLREAALGRWEQLSDASKVYSEFCRSILNI